MIKNLLLDLLFPRCCLGCNLEGKWLCDRCRIKLLEVTGDRKCKICNQKLKAFHFCKLDGRNFFALLDYHNRITAQLIAGFKYRYLTDLVDDVFAELLKSFWENSKSFFIDQTIILPLPIHYRKKLKRGFNQSELLAQKLSDFSGLKVANDLLFRVVNNKSQAGLGNIKDRRKNTVGIFKINYRALSRYQGRKILLLDDVYTTGCTIDEVIKVLEGAGFTDISVLVMVLN